jgi:hypothetical protein
LIGWSFASPLNDAIKDGYRFPSFYLNAAEYPAYLEQVLGVFTDASGVIIGSPFLVRSTPRNLVVPSGATNIQFGINDFANTDNSGALIVQISW